MTTARDLLTRSLRQIRVIGEDETPSAAMLNDALLDINDLIDTWSNERLFIYDVSPSGPYALTAGTPSYTLGSGGVINLARPLQVETAFIRISSVDYGITWKPFDWYQGMQLKAVQARPEYCWVETAYPLSVLWFWPTPDQAYSLYIANQQILSTLATLDTAFSVPQGYLRALRLAMSCELAPQYNVPINPAMEDQKRQAIAAIKRTNAQMNFSAYDQAILPRQVYNYYTG